MTSVYLLCTQPVKIPAQMTTSRTQSLKAHEHAIRISSEEIDLYVRRREEAGAFLAARGTPPEIATVLSYRPLEEPVRVIVFCSSAPATKAEH